MRSLTPSIVLFALLASGGSHACDATGAFGLRFGDKPGRGATIKDQSPTAFTYLIEPPAPDQRLDRYQVNADPQSHQIFEIRAVKTLIPFDGVRVLSKEERLEAEKVSYAFAQEYVTSLPAEVQGKLKERYAIWRGNLLPAIHLEVNAVSAWEVTVSCMDTRREAEIMRRVLPEIFGPGK